MPRLFLCSCLLLTACASLPFVSRLSPVPGGGAPGEAAASEPQPASGLAIGDIDKNLAKLLGKDALYSASTLQGTPSPMCEAKDDRVQSSVWSLDVHGRTECYAFDEGKAFSKPQSYESLRDFQDRGTIFNGSYVVPGKKSDAVFVSIANGKFFAVEKSGEISAVVAPVKESAQGLDKDFVLQHFDQFCDMSKATFDALTPDPGKGKALKLADEKQRLIARALVEVKKQGEERSKADAAKLQKVYFPAAVAISDSAGAVKAVKAYIAGSTKSEIDPASVKKVGVSSQWTVKKNARGLIFSRSADVTVGFARTDAYAIDPNKKCAFASFEVKAEYDGARYKPAEATGMATGWTNILCNRLK